MYSFKKTYFFEVPKVESFMTPMRKGSCGKKDSRSVRSRQNMWDWSCWDRAQKMKTTAGRPYQMWGQRDPGVWQHRGKQCVPAWEWVKVDWWQEPLGAMEALQSTGGYSEGLWKVGWDGGGRGGRLRQNGGFREERLQELVGVGLEKRNIYVKQVNHKVLRSIS